MSCLLYIRQIYASLAQNEQKLADFVLQHPEETRYLSSQQLAHQAGVSQSGVVKFAQKLGYKGFPALKIALSEVVVRTENQTNAINLHNHILSSDTLKVVGEKLLLEKQAALRTTLDLNSEEQLQKALTLLRQASRVIIVGIGASGLVAKDFSFKLLKIGVNALAESDMHVSLAAVQALQAQDLLIAISFTGKRREINLAAETAQQHGAQVIAITGLAYNPLQQHADLCLYTAAEEGFKRSAAISSSTAQQAITDLLYMALVQKTPQEAEERITQSSELVNKLG